jgi:hypothetical protein
MRKLPGFGKPNSGVGGIRLIPYRRMPPNLLHRVTMPDITSAAPLPGITQSDSVPHGSSICLSSFDHPIPALIRSVGLAPAKSWSVACKIERGPDSYEKRASYSRSLLQPLDDVPPTGAARSRDAPPLFHRSLPLLAGSPIVQSPISPAA